MVTSNLNKDFFIKHTRTMFIKLLFCCIVYSPIICFNLVNRQDGLWQGFYHFEGSWSVSLGRYLWPYLDKILMGLHTNPFSSIVTLFIFTIGTELMIDALNIERGTIKDYLISMLFLCNMIVCIDLSYTYMSCVFAISFTLGMLCAKCIFYSEKFEWKSIAVGALSLAAMMAFYQAYIGTCVLVCLVCIVLAICQNESFKNILNKIIRGITVAVAGFVLYEIGWEINLLIFNTERSSYNGANQSLSQIVKNIVPSMRKAYTFFFKYLTGNLHHWNMISDKLVLGILVLLISVFLVSSFLKIYSLGGGQKECIIAHNTSFFAFAFGTSCM